MKIPPPHKRLCPKHDKPICPREWKLGCRASGCWKCMREQKASPKQKEIRRLKWEREFISCARHPSRRCQKSKYVLMRARRCSACNHIRTSGLMHPANSRHTNKQSYDASMRKRSRSLGNNRTLRGLKLFERSTGLKLQ
jgi:hypothetical protein